MTPLEKDIEKHLTRAVGRAGGLCMKWVCPGWSGVPDRIVLMPGGRIAFVELKRPEGGKVSRLQIEWANRLRGLGFSFYFIHTHEGVKDFIDRELLGNRYTGIAFRGAFINETEVHKNEV